MITKRLLKPDRLRQVPPGFSWVDHRLVREGYICRCQAPALALYLFLVTVSDEQGLSYYSEKGLCRYLHFTSEELQQARRELIQADLIAYQKPLYQVLSLPEAKPVVSAGSGQPAGKAQSAGEILRQILGGTQP